MYTFRFQAMASPCEIQVDSEDLALARRMGEIAQGEALRIERKFSRYRTDSVVGQINASSGIPILLDSESALLIDYARNCHDLSEGLFDITSGVLRRAWRFDGSDRVPDAAQVAALMPHVGWDKIGWDGTTLTLRPGMEIDLGGLGKEYAVDRALGLIAAEGNCPVLVNFGGDLRVSGPRADGARWRVMIEAIGDDERSSWLELDTGAITTSGDARRFLERDGVRFSHILDPRSGAPVIGAPRAVTVAAPTCIEAGVLSTLAMLHGDAAEQFLEHEGVLAWVTR